MRVHRRHQRHDVARGGALSQDQSSSATCMGDWTAPVTNNLLIDGAFINRHQDQIRTVPPGLRQSRDDLRDGAGAGQPRLPHRERRRRPTHAAQLVVLTMFIRSAVSYITGGQSSRPGSPSATATKSTSSATSCLGRFRTAYRFNNGVPNQITLYGYPVGRVTRPTPTRARTIQDKWTAGRMTLSAGLRFDHFANSAPESVAGPTPVAADTQSRLPGHQRREFQGPHAQARRRLRSHRRRQDRLKVSLNKYVLGLSSGDAIFGSVLMPINRVGNATTRRGTTGQRSRQATRGTETTSRTAISRCRRQRRVRRHGQPELRPRHRRQRLQPRDPGGWGMRGYNWELSAGVQRETPAARLAGRQLLPALVRELLRHRQPRRVAG